MLDLPPLPRYRTQQRREELQRLGLSPPIVRLAMFDPPHPLFYWRCDDLGPPLAEWRDQQPPGAPMTWLWCCRGLVTGARAQERRRFPIISRICSLRSRLLFVSFKPDTPCTAYAIIARSEQGLLASVFAGLIADHYELLGISLHNSGSVPFPLEELEAGLQELLQTAADSVGFKYLAEIQAFCRKYGKAEDYINRLYAYTRSFR